MYLALIIPQFSIFLPQPNYSGTIKSVKIPRSRSPHIFDLLPVPVREWFANPHEVLWERKCGF